MSNNVLVMREEELNDFVGGLKQTQVQFDSTASDTPSRLSYMKRSDLFNQGINKITRQVNSISNSILNIEWMMQEHNRSFFGMERNLAKAASNIEIPTNFMINDSLVANTFSTTELSKEDGRSVNDGQALSKIDEVKDSSITNMKNLGNITSNLELKEEKIDDTSRIAEENLKNIKNDFGTEEQNVDESTIIQGKGLQDINNSNVQESQNINEQTNILSRNLGSINNNLMQNSQNLDMNTQNINKMDEVELQRNISDIINKINMNNMNLKNFSDLKNKEERE